MDITSCSKEELAQAVLELTIELGKTRRALSAALEITSRNASAVKTLEQMKYTYHGGEMWKPPIGKPPFFTGEYKFPAIDPMAVDVRSVV